MDDVDVYREEVWSMDGGLEVATIGPLTEEQYQHVGQCDVLAPRHDGTDPVQQHQAQV